MQVTVNMVTVRHGRDLGMTIVAAEQVILAVHVASHHACMPTLPSLVMYNPLCPVLSLL